MNHRRFYENNNDNSRLLLTGISVPNINRFAGFVRISEQIWPKLSLMLAFGCLSLTKAKAWFPMVGYHFAVKFQHSLTKAKA